MHTVTTAEIREAWGAIIAGENPLTQKYADVLSERHFPRWRSSEPMEWAGCTGAEINHRLQHGYSAEGDAVDLSGVGQTLAPMVELVEDDGDLLIDAALNGDDLFRARWEEMPAPRGLTMRADIGFSADVDASEMARYTDWLLRMRDAAERKGYRVDLELQIKSRSPYDRSGNGPVETIVIPLVKAGELIDPVAWRAFVSPGAFRTLGFLAKGIVAGRERKRLTSGLGWPGATQWSATLEGDVLNISVKGSDRNFPEQAMTDAVNRALA